MLILEPNKCFNTKLNVFLFIQGSHEEWEVPTKLFVLRHYYYYWQLMTADSAALCSALLFAPPLPQAPSNNTDSKDGNVFCSEPSPCTGDSIFPSAIFSPESSVVISLPSCFLPIAECLQCNMRYKFVNKAVRRRTRASTLSTPCRFWGILNLRRN